MIELVLGGARSGKSRYAEHTALNSGKRCFYLATAQALDEEMRQRIAHHQQQRSAQWTSIEETIQLASLLANPLYNQPNHCIVIDCLTLWLTNCLLAEADIWSKQKAALLAQLPQSQADIILVSNETSLGIVPLDALSRRFVDEAGWLHQAIAHLADKVSFISAGLPLSLKPPTQGSTL